MAMTVVGIFDTRDHATAAVDQLVAAGFARETVSVLHGERSDDEDETVGSNLAPDDDLVAPVTTVTPDWGMAGAGAADSAGTSRVVAAEDDPDTDSASVGDRIGAGPGAAAGAGTGAVIGAGAGLLAGAIGMFIPGLGPILGVGPIAATILGGAGIGAVAGGLTGGLINAGVPDDDAAAYAEGVRRGGVLVLVTAHDQAKAEAAADLLSAAGAYDIDERAATWQEVSQSMTAGGNADGSFLSVVPESSQTAEVSVVPPAGFNDMGTKAIADAESTDDRSDPDAVPRQAGAAQRKVTAL